MASTAAARVHKQLPEETLPAAPELLKETVPTLRELEAMVAEQTVRALERERQKAGFFVRLFRELGLLEEPGLCNGFTRQAKPCRRLAIRDGYCRLHVKPLPAKLTLWQRLTGTI